MTVLIFFSVLIQLATFMAVVQIVKTLRIKPDFTKEDESVLDATEQIQEAQKRIPKKER